MEIGRGPMLPEVTRFALCSASKNWKLLPEGNSYTQTPRDRNRSCLPRPQKETAIAVIARWSLNLSTVCSTGCTKHR